MMIGVTFEKTRKDRQKQEDNRCQIERGHVRATVGSPDETLTGTSAITDKQLLADNMMEITPRTLFG